MSVISGAFAKGGNDAVSQNFNKYIKENEINNIKLYQGGKDYAN